MIRVLGRLLKKITIIYLYRQYFLKLLSKINTYAFLNNNSLKFKPNLIIDNVFEVSIRYKNNKVTKTELIFFIIYKL